MPRSKRAGERGQAILEAAVMLPILVFLALGMIDMQWALSDAGTLNYIVMESARCEALSSPSCTGANTAGTYATALGAQLHLTASRLTIGVFNCNIPIPGACSVTATYNYPALGVWFPSITITRTGTAVIQP
jgi:Flp pilus assembly protein TadG